MDLSSFDQFTNSNEQNNWKGVLQEYCVTRKLSFPVYNCTSSKGEAHCRSYISKVDVGKVSYVGQACKTLKGSEQSAARIAYQALKNQEKVAIFRSQPLLSNSRITLGDDSCDYEEKELKEPENQFSFLNLKEQDKPPKYQRELDLGKKLSSVVNLPENVKQVRREIRIQFVEALCSMFQHKIDATKEAYKFYYPLLDQKAYLVALFRSIKDGVLTPDGSGHLVFYEIYKILAFEKLTTEAIAKMLFPVSDPKSEVNSLVPFLNSCPGIKAVDDQDTIYWDLDI